MQHVPSGLQKWSSSHLRQKEPQKMLQTFQTRIVSKACIHLRKPNTILLCFLCLHSVPKAVCYVEYTLLIYLKVTLHHV